MPCMGAAQQGRQLPLHRHAALRSHPARAAAWRTLRKGVSACGLSHPQPNSKTLDTLDSAAVCRRAAVAGPAAALQHCWLCPLSSGVGQAFTAYLHMSCHCRWLCCQPCRNGLILGKRCRLPMNKLSTHVVTPVIHHPGLLPGKHPASIWNGRNCNCWMCYDRHVSSMRHRRD